MNFEFYEKDGAKYDRITSILDFFPPPSLVDWKIKVGRREAGRISKIATNIGTNVDEAIKADVQGLKIPKLKTQEAKNCWEAYCQWKRDYGLTLGIPNTVFNDGLRVAGTPDLTNNLTIIDVKCSARISDSYWLQTEFYGRTFFGEGDKAILRLDKNLALYEYKKVPLNDEHWEAVRSAIKLYRYFNKPERDASQMEEV